MPTDALSRILLLKAPPQVRSSLSARSGLEAELQSILRAGEAQHGLHIEPELFLSFLAERLPQDGDPGRLEVGDLYLACACLSGVPGAAEKLVQLLTPALDRALARTGADKALQEDARQTTLAELLAPERGRSKLVDYAGRGPLSAWLQVVGLRNLLQLERAKRGMREDALDSVLELPLENSAGSLAAFDRERLKVALQTAASSLTPRERTVLKLNFVEGLNIEEIGAIYSVHRATVARWIASAREALLKRTRAQLADGGAQGEALESLLRLADSRLDLSLSTLLHVSEGER